MEPIEPCPECGSGCAVICDGTLDIVEAWVSCSRCDYAGPPVRGSGHEWLNEYESAAIVAHDAAYKEQDKNIR